MHSGSEPFSLGTYIVHYNQFYFNVILIYADILGYIPCSIRCADGNKSCRCPIGNADKNGSKRVGRIRMRTEQPKNRSYISAKIWQFWIGPSTVSCREMEMGRSRGCIATRGSSGDNKKEASTRK